MIFTVLRAIRNRVRYRLRYPDASIHYRANVSADTRISKGVVVESGALVAGSSLGSVTRIGAGVYVNESSLGEETVVKPDCSLDKVTCEHNVAFHGSGNFHEATIGCYSYIAPYAKVSMVEIGRFCSIGPFLICGYGDHPIDFISTSPLFFSNGKQCGVSFSEHDLYDERKQIHIGHDVWIGARVFIRDGVSVGNGAVIAAGSVVVKDIPAYAIVGGVPAKVIRFRFQDDIIARMQNLQWWDWPEEKLRAAQPYLAQNSIDSFFNWVTHNC